jgi:predicted molibdopterin-dependent oxidoreductase YjgC
LRIENHPVLGVQPDRKEIEIVFDGKKLKAFEGEMIATALMAAGIKTFRYTSKRGEPRGIFCAIGRCTDCVMEVDGVSNVRTCVTPAKAGMVVNTQIGLGQWKEGSN